MFFYASKSFENSSRIVVFAVYVHRVRTRYLLSYKFLFENLWNIQFARNERCGSGYANYCTSTRVCSTELYFKWNLSWFGKRWGTNERTWIYTKSGKHNSWQTPFIPSLFPHMVCMALHGGTITLSLLSVIVVAKQDDTIRKIGWNTWGSRITRVLTFREHIESQADDTHSSKWFVPHT